MQLPLSKEMCCGDGTDPDAHAFCIVCETTLCVVVPSETQTSTGDHSDGHSGPMQPHKLDHWKVPMHNDMAWLEHCMGMLSATEALVHRLMH